MSRGMKVQIPNAGREKAAAAKRGKRQKNASPVAVVTQGIIRHVNADKRPPAVSLIRKNIVVLADLASHY